MTKDEVLAELKTYGNENTKKVFLNHGAKEPFFGVKVQDLKKIQKKVKKDYELAKDLYNTGNSDAMYLAGLIADEGQMTKKDLESWVKGAYWYMISEYTVPWVTAESAHGLELALQWIESDEEMIAAAGWATISYMLALTPDEELDLKLLDQLLDRVEKEIHRSPNRVRYVMNGYIIALGSYVSEFTEKAIEVGEKVGKVRVDVGNTACKVPLAPDYIKKVIDRGSIGKKRKTARC